MDTSKLGVLVVTHRGRVKWLQACVDTCREMNPNFVVCCMEARLDAKRRSMEELMPDYDILKSFDAWFISEFYHTVASWRFLQMYGLHLLKATEGIEYVFSINGDCVLERPEGIHDLYEMLVEIRDTGCKFRKTDITLLQNRRG